MPHSPPRYQSNFQDLPLDALDYDPDQPRRASLLDDIEKLLRSIQEWGILQPLAVHTSDGERFVIIDGHRRYHCARSLQLETVPCAVYSHLHKADIASLRMALQDNHQPWTQAEGTKALKRIKALCGFQTHREVAAHLPTARHFRPW